MPEKRMIWKSVSTSRKVNKLSIKAALLWTWCIPYFDVGGYLEVEADDLKFRVMPRRNDIKEDEIQKLVDEIVQVGLWLRCKTDNGTEVVFDPKFVDMQKVRKDQEAPSKWENKCEIIEITTAAQQEGNSSTTEVQQQHPRLIKVSKLNKVKESKEKVREYVTLSQDDFKKLQKRYTPEQLEWCFNKLDAWQSAKDKPKIINGYGYFKKGSWLLEEMEKHIFHRQGPKYEDWTGKAQEEFTPEEIERNKEFVRKLADKIGHKGEIE